MFDEQNNNPIPPTNLPAEPEDMFSGVEKNSLTQETAEIPDALSNGLLRKKLPIAATPPGLLPVNEDVHMGNYKMSSPILGKIILSLVILLLVGGLAYGSWWFFYGRNNNTETKNNTGVSSPKAEVKPAEPASNSNAPTNLPSQIENDEILFGEGVDLDKDGLDDIREKEIKTNPQNADSDGDGLNDGDEVIIYKSSPLNGDTDADFLSDGDEILIWKTNILNPDSDNDSYPDGTEVKNGYSPLGPGKLFSSPTTTTVATTTTSTPK